MLERYKETFDGIHASQRLKTEVLNMKREENVVKKRKIPAMALIVAILVFALAGTALAAGYLGRVTILPMDQVPPGIKFDATSIIYGNCERIPLESLSDEVLAFAVETGIPGDGAIKADREFASFSECELFLGLELADNPMLEQPWYEDGNPVPSTVSVFSRHQIPYEFSVASSYEVDGYRINAYAVLRTESAPDEADYDITSRWDPDEFEDYVTRSGMEVKIVTEKEFVPGWNTCWSSFSRNNAVFVLALGEENGDMDAMLDTMKEVLEAYE